MYKILTHYVSMETYEVPDELVVLNESGEIMEDETFQNILDSEEDYVVKTDTRDFEIVDYQHIKEE